VRAPRFGYAELQSLAGGTGRVSESLFRVRRNLESCAAMNADMETRYYDDAQVEAALDRLGAEAQLEEAEAMVDVRRCIDKLRRDPVLAELFVLKSDFFRLAILFLDGGW
jgi:hypothetical protein